MIKERARVSSGLGKRTNPVGLHLIIKVLGERIGNLITSEKKLKRRENLSNAFSPEKSRSIISYSGSAMIQIHSLMR